MTSPPPFDRQPADSTTPDPAARTGLPASVAMSMARWPAQKYWVITAPGTGQRSLPVPTAAEYGAGAGAGAVTWATWAARLGVGAGLWLAQAIPRLLSKASSGFPTPAVVRPPTHTAGSPSRAGRW